MYVLGQLQGELVCVPHKFCHETNLKRNGFPKRENLADTTNQIKTSWLWKLEWWPASSCWVRRQVFSTSSCLPRHRNQSKNSTSVADTSFGFCGGHLGRECVLAIPFSPLFPSCKNWMFSVQLNMNMKVNRTCLERKVILLQVRMPPPPSD